jgi:hypothetical protein
VSLAPTGLGERGERLMMRRDIEDICKNHFDYFYREYDESIFPLTIHPDVSGRPHVC